MLKHVSGFFFFAETRVKSAFVWDYFQQQIDGHFVLWRVFAVSLT